jgi:hypothetical protein
MCDAIGDELFYQKGRFITPLLSNDMEKLNHECETAQHDFKMALLQKETYTKSKLITDISLKIHEANMLDIKKSNMERYEEKLSIFLTTTVKEKVVLDRCILQTENSMSQFLGFNNMTEDFAKKILSVDTPVNEKTIMIHDVVFPTTDMNTVLESFMSPMLATLNKQQQLVRLITMKSYEFMIQNMDQQLAKRDATDITSVLLHSHIVYNSYSSALITAFMKVYLRKKYLVELVNYANVFKLFKCNTHLINLLAEVTKSPETIEDFPPLELITFKLEKAMNSLDAKVLSLTAANAAEEEKKKETKVAAQLKLLHISKGLPKSSSALAPGTNLSVAMEDTPSVTEVIQTIVETVQSGQKQKRKTSAPRSAQVGNNPNKKMKPEAKQQASPDYHSLQQSSFKGRGRGGRGGVGGRQINKTSQGSGSVPSVSSQSVLQSFSSTSPSPTNHLSRPSLSSVDIHSISNKHAAENK